jgi:phosphoribosylamine--glycine ligase
MYGSWFALRLREEGHDVKIFLSEEEYHNILSGIVPRPWIVSNRIYPHYGNFDLSIFDLTGRPKQADLSATMCPTLGDGSFNCQAEDDRLFGLQMMEQAGIKVPPYQQFSDVNSAAAFVKETGKRYVYKPNGGQDQDTDTTYVSENAVDMLANLPKLFTKTKGAPFILQEFVAGIEVSIEGWFNGTDFYLLNCTLEEKKFMNGGKGPNTGCAGNLIFHFGNSEPKVFRDGLKKMQPLLQAAGYVGMIDLNTIATPMGLYGLEWTPRFGYDASAALVQLYGGNFGEMLQRTCLGQRPDISWKAEFAAGVRLSIPPYPSEIRGKHPAGIACDGITKEDYASTFMYDLELQKNQLVTAGHSGFICTPMGVGNSIAEAFDECGDRIKRIKLANAQYRTDIESKVRQRYYELDKDGWLK